MDEFDRADIDAARRLADEEHRGSRSISRASTIFCWLPPEKFAVFSRQLAGGYRTARSSSARHRASRAISRNGPFRNRDRPDSRGRNFPIPRMHDEARAVAVLRYVREAASRQRRADRCASEPAPARRARMIVAALAWRMPASTSRTPTGRCRRRRRCRRSRRRAPRRKFRRSAARPFSST